MTKNRERWKMSEDYEELDIRDILYDPDNTDPIVMQDENGKDISFEQVAVLPIEKTVYVLLKPLDQIEGIADDEMLVFRIAEEGDNATLEIVTDRKLTDRVYEEFVKLVEEEDVGE